MTAYVFDIGFDWNGSTCQETGKPYLDCGFVPYATQTGPERGLQVGDTIGFNGFNKTSGATLATANSYQITGGTISFQAENTTQAIQSPFEITTFDISNLGQATRTGPSQFFGMNTQFPCWWPVLAPQSIVNNGSFQFSVSLTVQGPDGSTKTFLCPDPEMIVGGAG
jgi:hypothetical protein